jgi:transcriptional regulator with XRE-family HTH domain
VTDQEDFDDARGGELEAGEQVGRNLRRLRESKDLTLHEVASGMGVKTATVSRWETGHAWPSAAGLRTYCRLLGLDTGGLFLPAPPNPASPPAPEDLRGS